MKSDGRENVYGTLKWTSVGSKVEILERGNLRGKDGKK
jgi:hypothetical protein